MNPQNSLPAASSSSRIRCRDLRRWSFVLALVVTGAAAPISPTAAEPVSLESHGLRLTLNPRTGLPDQIQTRQNGAIRDWLTSAMRLQVRNQVTTTNADFATVVGNLSASAGEAADWQGRLTELPLQISQRWSATAQGVAWDLDFQGDSARVEHQIQIELPALSTNLHVFTPTERGVMQLAGYPSFKPSPYAANGWDTGSSYVLPLISLFDPQTDQALTVALPADANIPHLQFEWRDARVLTLTLARRGMGGGRPSPLRLLLFTHPADYRSALRSYSDAFPAWFKTSASREQGEGTFYYHHIQDHPEFAEMERQSVRFLWSSFWFTHLGEYLPNLPAWEPYTYAKWWKLGQTMTDAKILTFLGSLRDHGIRTYAYFNLTEYGGAGGKSGGTAEAARILREKFANALIKDAAGHDIPTWEGAMAMNPGSRYALWPFLEDQVRRHLQRLPGLAGFVIDRLDWAGVLDYGHDDGLCMVGARPVENMALPVREGVRGVARLAHAANLKLFVNQFYRIEPLEDADGVCHENDYLPALGYLTPLRPASAWHHSKPYDDDLLSFEAQLKRRLYWALFPQMIAHEFPISQQPPSARAADLLELYAPLFDTLLGKEQVLLPHCIEVTGANDANLFRTPAGRYVASIASRTRFLSRQAVATEPVELVLRVPDAADLQWGHAVSVDGLTPAVRVQATPGLAKIHLAAHGTATMIVLGKDTEPVFDDPRSARLVQTREKFLGRTRPEPPAIHRAAIQSGDRLFIRVAGTHVGTAGPIHVSADGTDLGTVPAQLSRGMVPWKPGAPPETPPQVTLTFTDEGTWFVPERVELIARHQDQTGQRLCVWQPGMAMISSGSASSLSFPLVWSDAPLSAGTARFLSRDRVPNGRWQGQVGAQGVWIPNVTGDNAAQNGWRLEIQTGQTVTWPASTNDDPRVLLPPTGGRPMPTCWFADDHLAFRVVAPDNQPYRLTLYCLDYDRNGRAMDVMLSDDLTVLNTQRVQTAETVAGVRLSWSVRGSMNLELRKVAGFNAVLSGVFIDPEPAREK